jgi:hypothetical protein
MKRLILALLRGAAFAASSPAYAARSESCCFQTHALHVRFRAGFRGMPDIERVDPSRLDL